MSHADPTLKDIAKMLAMLKPEQIASIMAKIPKPNRAYAPKVYHIDYSERIKRFAINDLYFRSASQPHMHESFEDYREHDEAIRRQVLSGVDL